MFVSFNVKAFQVQLNGKFSNALIRLDEGSSEKVNKLRLFVEKIKSDRLPNFR